MTKPTAAREPASNVEWRLFGKLDVGVSHDYASGIAEWTILKSHLQHYGLRDWNTACEIGCGAGRMTNAVAADFRVVHALDVSEERIAQAHTAPNASKFIFHRVSEPTIPLPDESCDLVYSIHVFQHFSSDCVVETYFREIHRVLKPGGVLLIHLPMVGAHGFTGHVLETMMRNCGFFLRRISATIARMFVRMGLASVLESLGILVRKVGVQEYSGGASIYRVFSYVKVAELFCNIGLLQPELRILPVRGFHSYAFARKSPFRDLSLTTE